MEKLLLFESFTDVLNDKKQKKQLKKDSKWLKNAIKNPGKLHKELDVPEEDTIPMSKIDSKIKELKSIDELSKKESKLLRRLNLAKTMKKFNK